MTTHQAFAVPSVYAFAASALAASAQSQTGSKAKMCTVALP